ncbi:MAG: hypothetical protein J0I99_08940 [Devosia sp.]|uniref:hypothetical protein n=1 Tax=Devosia sp. TaxID=1871048 RepID=UPI001AC7CB28|nr:hypothetical protein [Devosia sp.]MBN9309203.1 hypothetical protein [Devosia sp.]MBN9315851.1 hypothetical protein [Devosia sp.]
MTLKTIARLAGVLVLGASLAGCMDVTAEIDVLSETAGKATTTMTVGAEFYPMIKQMQEAAKAGGEEAESSDSSFCQDEGDVLTENGDGSATCTSVKEGNLTEITADGEGPNQDTIFTVVSPGVVRVAFKTDEMKSQVTQGEEQDEQTAQMMKAYFEGHSATIRIKGKKIVETNMTKVGDNAAETVIPFTDLLDGNVDLPAELYAVVDTR